MAAELCRLKLLATPFAGNVPHHDIIASGQSGGHLAVQVKATNTSTWQFDISKFAEVQLLDGRRQVIGQRRPAPYPNLMCVLVQLKGTGQDRFFVLEWKELQGILWEKHKEYLLRHGGIRPKSPASFHCALKLEDVKA